MKIIKWKRALAAVMLLSLLSGVGPTGPAGAISLRSAAQEKIASLTADGGTWIQSWDRYNQGPYDLILGQETDAVRLTPTPEDTSGYPPRMELFDRDPATDAGAEPLLTLTAGQPSEEIAVAAGQVQKYWLRTTSWNGGTPFTYALKLYRTPILTELRMADVRTVGGAKQLSLEIWLDAATDTGLKTVAVDFAFDPELLQLANAETNEPVSAVSGKIGVWHDSVKNNMTFTASSVNTKTGAFHLELQGRKNSDNTGTLTCPVAEGRTLLATVAFRMAEGTVLDERAVRLSDIWCAELTPDGQVLKTTGTAATGYYSWSPYTKVLTLPIPQAGGQLLMNGEAAQTPKLVPYGQTVRVTAQPDGGHRFDGWVWSGAGEPPAAADSDGAFSMILVSDVDLSGYTPVFTKLLSPDLPEPELDGCAVVITDVDGKPLSGAIPEGTPVLMRAVPSPGRWFVRWEQTDRPAGRMLTAAVPDLTQEVLRTPYLSTTTYLPITEQAEYLSEEEYNALPVIDNLILSGIQGRELVRRALAQGDVGFTGLCLQYDLYLRPTETTIGLTPVFKERWSVTWSVDGGAQTGAASEERLDVTGLSDGSVIHFYVNEDGRSDVPIEYTVTVHWSELELRLRSEPIKEGGAALKLTAAGGQFYAVEFSFDLPSGTAAPEPEPLAGYVYQCLVKGGRMTVVISREDGEPSGGGDILTLNFSGNLNLLELNAAGKVTTETHMDIHINPWIAGMVKVSGSVWSHNTGNQITVTVNRRSSEEDTYSGYADVELPGRETHTVREFAQDFTLDLEGGYLYQIVVTKLGHTAVTLSDLAVGTEDISLAVDYGAQLGRDGIHLPCGDGNGDGRINVFDKAELTALTRYGGAADGAWDLDGDGYVNVFDLNILTNLKNYGKHNTIIQLKKGGA